MGDPKFPKPGDPNIRNEQVVHDLIREKGLQGALDHLAGVGQPENPTVAPQEQTHVNTEEENTLEELNRLSKLSEDLNQLISRLKGKATELPPNTLNSMALPSFQSQTRAFIEELNKRLDEKGL